MHLGSDIFEFADSVEDLAAPRGLVNDAARDAELRCGGVLSGNASALLREQAGSVLRG